MAWETIENRKPSAAAARVPEMGVRVSTRAAMRKARYIRIQIGAKLAKAIALTMEEHRIRVMFGTGPDAGKVAVSVDNGTGNFPVRRDAKGNYVFTINAHAAKGRFSLDFQTFERNSLEAIRPTNGQPPMFTFLCTGEMLDHGDIA